VSGSFGIAGVFNRDLHVFRRWPFTRGSDNPYVDHIRDSVEFLSDIIGKDPGAGKKPDILFAREMRSTGFLQALPAMNIPDQFFTPCPAFILPLWMAGRFPRA
jgi:hypothetical protein